MVFLRSFYSSGEMGSKYIHKLCKMNEMVTGTMEKKTPWQGKEIESDQCVGWGGISAALSRVASEEVTFWGRRVPQRDTSECA